MRGCGLGHPRPAPQITTYEDLNFKGTLALEQRENGRRLWDDIAREGGPRKPPIVICAQEIARLFRDFEPERDKKEENLGAEFKTNARRFAKHCQLYHAKIVTAHSGRFFWFDFNGTDGEEHLGEFCEWARRAGEEAVTLSRRLQSARTKSSKDGFYIGGTARVGHYSVPIRTPAEVTKGLFLHPIQLLYLPHARVVAKWWKVALLPAVTNVGQILRYARRQTELYLATGGKQGDDYRFAPFPQHLHEYGIGSTAFRRMTCAINARGFCACSPGRNWGEFGDLRELRAHHVWRIPLRDENDKPYHEPIPWEECVPVFPKPNMVLPLLINPIYLGDRLQNEEAITHNGLFRHLDRDAMLAEDFEKAVAEIREKAQGVLNNRHHPHLRLCRGVSRFATQEDIEEAFRTLRLNDITEGDDALSPDADWRPPESEFWELCQKYCIIDMRRWRDSGYAANEIVANPDCVVMRGRPVASVERTPYYWVGCGPRSARTAATPSSTTRGPIRGGSPRPSRFAVAEKAATTTCRRSAWTGATAMPASAFWTITWSAVSRSSTPWRGRTAPSCWIGISRRPARTSGSRSRTTWKS